MTKKLLSAFTLGLVLVLVSNSTSTLSEVNTQLSLKGDTEFRTSGHIQPDIM